jgi:hypothetical protein
MSKPDENQIKNRLKNLSQIEPTKEAADRAIERTKKILTQTEDTNKSTRKIIFTSAFAKFTAAAVILISLGYIVGRFSAPKTLDMQEIQAALESSLKSSLEPAIRKDLLEQVNKHWQSQFTANLAALKNELQQQVRLDMADFAAQTVTATRMLTNQRFSELIELIEAAREQDRRQIEAAFEKIEQDKSRLGNGLVALATQTDELLRTKQN